MGREPVKAGLKTPCRSRYLTWPGLIFYPGGAGKRRLPEVDFSVLSCGLKFWSRTKMIFNIAAPRRFPAPETKQFGSQTV